MPHARQRTSGRGGSALFVCREHEGHLGALIRDRGHALALLPKPAAGFGRGGAPSYAAWLGASWETDAAETCAAVLAKGTRADWIVSDHYALDWRWQRAVSSIASSYRRVVVPASKGPRDSPEADEPRAGPAGYPD